MNDETISKELQVSWYQDEDDAKIIYYDFFFSPPHLNHYICIKLDTKQAEQLLAWLDYWLKANQKEK